MNRVFQQTVYPLRELAVASKPFMRALLVSFDYENEFQFQLQG